MALFAPSYVVGHVGVPAAGLSLLQELVAGCDREELTHWVTAVALDFVEFLRDQ